MIAALIVTYNPEKNGFLKLIAAIEPQVEKIIVVDNGSSVPVADWIGAVSKDKIDWIPLGENKGIAAAQNVGIARAKDVLADKILLLDHDSLPFPDMVAQLDAALRKKQAQGVKVAAIGACYKDVRRDNPPPFVRIEGLMYKRIPHRAGEDIVPVDHVIASGSLIPMETLNGIGGMREELFIDYVDVEWGMRAKAQGYQSFGAFDANMAHQLGDETLCLLGRRMALHSPLRHYYMFRNAVWLYQQNFVPLHWKIVDGFRFFVRFFCYALCTHARRSHVVNMVQGVWDGLHERLGKKGGS